MPKPGDVLVGRYRILERLGAGGMATVDRALDERLQREVAIKVLLPNLADDPSTAARFEREARSLAAAAHPGVVAVYDVDPGDPATGREPFFVMELCPGGSLADRLAGGRRIAPDDLIPILVPVADGLADLHRRGVVHRDIKPHNILFAADRAKLADFGLALDDAATGLSELTAPGTAVGTLAYLAPELLAGERATSASDLYALGVVAFVGLTGTLPRPAGSMAELVAASRSVARLVSEAAPDLGTAFDEILGATLAADPDGRPDALAFASGMTSALGRWARDGGPARRAVATLPGVAPTEEGSLNAIARVAPGDRIDPDERTTAVAIPLGATAAVPVIADDRPGPDAGPRTSETRRSTGWVAPAAAIAAVVLLVAAVLGAFNARSPVVGVAGPSGSVLPSAEAGSPSIAPPSIAPSPSPAPPSPTADPALAALDAMDAAIAAARGGRDGLKGKEANDLQNRAQTVRRALEAGDRAKALDEAGKLDRRVDDVSKRLGDDQAARLRSASANLVRALSG